MMAASWSAQGEVFVHHTAEIGSGTRLGYGVYVGPNVKIGKGCIVAPGARIGQPGFGYERDEDGRWEPKAHLFGVVIGDDVHVGANTCIDRGSWCDTLISRGARIDNLVHVAHNVYVGADAVVVACAELSGSVRVERGAWIGPSACILQRLTVGQRALVGMGAVVIHDVPANVTVAGNPARVVNEEVGVRERM